MKDCRFIAEFIKMMLESPDMIIQSFCYFDIIKPLVWKDLRRNGGKFGYRGVAKKYAITQSQARTIIKNIQNEQ